MASISDKAWHCHTAHQPCSVLLTGGTIRAVIQQERSVTANALGICLSPVPSYSQQPFLVQGSDIVTALKVYSKWMEVGSHTPSNSRPGSAGGASQADDNASEASSEYSTGSVYGGHFSQQGAAAANRWCDEYSVNGKTLGMARAARADIIKQLASANIALVSDHEAECGADDINQMFAAGFFQNLASKRGSANSFLAAESQQVGAIHPSSAYNELHPNTWSHWLSFMELFRSSQIFLMQVAPFNIEWLAQLAPLYHQERGYTLKVCISPQASDTHGYSTAPHCPQTYPVQSLGSCRGCLSSS